MQAVKYIGQREEFHDRLYGTNLRWQTGQVRMLPPHLAAKFLRHADQFEGVKAGRKAVQDDDTPALLEQAEHEQAERDQALVSIQAMYLEVQTMDKDALATFVERNYRQTIDKRHAVETLRQDVTRMIDQFGVI
jgi:hypothetical protein